MLVVTWNVLHRIHAENWREQVPDLFPDEGVRVAAIAARVRDVFAAALRAGETVVACLQEVSGDQLEALREGLRALLLPEAIHTLQYPRLPTLKGPGPCPLKAPAEFLVTIVGGANSATLVASAFDNDPGKGFLVVDAGGLVLLNTHLSAKDRRAPQLARLVTVIDAAGVSVVCGDCNTDAATVIAGLGSGFALVDLGADPLPTRPRAIRADGADGASDKPPAIDHILVRVRGAVGHDGAVVDVGGTSDHNLVAARVRPGP